MEVRAASLDRGTWHLDALQSSKAARPESITVWSTRPLLREGGDGFVEAFEASELEPPDAPLLEWSDLYATFDQLIRTPCWQNITGGAGGGLCGDHPRSPFSTGLASLKVEPIAGSD